MDLSEILSAVGSRPIGTLDRAKWYDRYGIFDDSSPSQTPLFEIHFNDEMEWAFARAQAGKVESALYHLERAGRYMKELSRSDIRAKFLSDSHTIHEMAQRAYSLRKEQYGFPQGAPLRK